MLIWPVSLSLSLGGGRGPGRALPRVKRDLLLLPASPRPRRGPPVASFAACLAVAVVSIRVGIRVDLAQVLGALRVLRNAPHGADSDAA